MSATSEKLPKAQQTKYQLRRTPRQARARATVDAVLEAAAQVLVEVGYSKANTNHIAAVAGVSIGSLYEYFPGKEAIYAELRRREGLKTYHLLVDEPRPTTSQAVLEHLVKTYIARFRDHQELLVALPEAVVLMLPVLTMILLQVVPQQI